MRVGTSSGEISVDYATSNGTATADSDYVATSDTVTFVDGDTAPKTFNVTLIDDGLVEGVETVHVSFSNPIGGSLNSPSTAILTISDDDAKSTSWVRHRSGGKKFARLGAAVHWITQSNGSPDTLSTTWGRLKALYPRDP